MTNLKLDKVPSSPKKERKPHGDSPAAKFRAFVYCVIAYVLIQIIFAAATAASVQNEIVGKTFDCEGFKREVHPGLPIVAAILPIYFLAYRMDTDLAPAHYCNLIPND